jgi:hypothetical protein
MYHERRAHALPSVSRDLEHPSLDDADATVELGAATSARV